MSTTTSAETLDADGFAEKVLGAALGAMETVSLYLGDRVGWIAGLAESPATPSALARRTGTQERYAREWLEMQAVYGNVVVQADATPASERTYALSPGAAEVLTDPHSLAYLGPLPRLVAAVGRQLDALASAYRDGGGVSWAALGADAREAQAALNRPWFESRLAHALAGVPELHERLSRPGARFADIGCGAGWSSLALARAYPAADVHAFDVDEPSLALARDNARVDGGAGERVHFALADAAGSSGLAAAGPYAAVFAFECLHDLAHPVELLAQARAALEPDGLVVVMDEAVAEEFTAPGDALEQAMYGFSTLICLPDGLSVPGSAGTGTVMRPPVLRAYAEQAGFSGVEVLPVDDFAFFRFYLLRP